MNKYPLLLTATIIPQTNYELKLTDTKKRYFQYINNLVNLISNSNFTEFIFCENSLEDIKDKDMLYKLCDFYGKKIEFLSFKGNEKLIQKYTRAYGDQEIIEYALDNSEILKRSKGFYKITGRYGVKNINNIIKSWENMENVFIKGGIGMETVHTCFFKVSKEYFKIHFYGKYKQLENYPNNSLEYLYYDKIKQSGVNMNINNLHPIFSGEYGAGGIMDESKLMRLKTLIFSRLGVYNIKTTKNI
ncbi:MAG: hypothetical protein PHV23_00140 [Candidatus Gracilibacteria bacterium]|nr:hypothetical protein [Candidatus Gracilibacteria bacterium]